MRYIDIQATIDNIPQHIRDNLQTVDLSMQGKTDVDKQAAVRDGNQHWAPLKPHLQITSHRKCWYTESRNSGNLYDVDHFRPKGRILNSDGTINHWYWFLAFNPSNFRLSCQISNRLNNNSVLGATGGKGDSFPLFPGSFRAFSLAGVLREQPVLLDPCCQGDAELLAFQADGRPVVNMEYAGDAAACSRVEQSKLLLNLDYPTFNEDRQHLYNRVRQLVQRGDSYEIGNPALEHIKEDLQKMMRPEAEYSKAAECYIRCFRDRGWVEELFV